MVIIISQINNFLGTGKPCDHPRGNNQPADHEHDTPRLFRLSQNTVTEKKKKCKSVNGNLNRLDFKKWLN